MKKIILASLLGLMIGSTACEDNKEEFLSDYDTVMYFRNSGIQELTCYVTGENTDYTLSVVKAGYNDKSISDAKVSVLEAAQLDIYNSENGTDYMVLPENCYTFNGETSLTFTADDMYKLVGVSFKPAEIKALGEGNYVLPLVLTSSKSVNEEKNVLIVKPTAVSLVLSMDMEQNTVYSVPRGIGVITIPLKLQIENQWDFQVKVSIDPATTSMDVSSLSLENDGIVTFTPGNDGVLKINVNGFEGLESGTVGIKIESIEGKSFEFDSQVYQFSCSKEYPLTVGMLSTNASQPGDGSLAEMIDKDFATIFHSAYTYAVDGYHYVQVTLPETFKKFVFSYRNRDSNNNTAMAWFNLYGGSDNENLQLIKAYAWDTDNLPPNNGGKEFISTELSVDEAINMLRLECTGSWTGTRYFSISEFRLYVLE
ncbi:MAG: DUF1735 domain-containing protein [Bacteroidaceae bacterium]|nr:DUF1735 domain-containing protein [Bacteroidaceae bacterium]